MTTTPTVRGQLAAIAQLRWLIFVHSLRSLHGALELVSRIFIGLAFSFFGFGGAISLGAGAWYFLSHGEAYLLALLLWPVFAFWQFFPIVATTFTETLDSSNLVRFPLNYHAYVLVRVVYGSLDPATLVGSLWLLGIAIGIGLAEPRIFLWSAFVLITFAMLNLLLTQMIFAWVERWLAQRRTREIFAVLFFLAMLSLQLVGPMLNRFSAHPNPAMVKFGRQLEPLQRALPPGLAAAAIADMAGGHVLVSLATLGLLDVYGAIFLRILNVRLRAQYRGENLSEVSQAEITRNVKAGVRPGWDLPGLSGPVTAVLEKEFHYLSRSGPMLLTLVTPIIMLLIFGLGQGRSARGAGFLQRSPDMSFPAGAAYSLLLLTNLVYNTFGGDGGGVQFFLASPVRFRRVMLGKNLAHLIVLAIEVLFVWIGVSLIFHPPRFSLTVMTLAGLLFAAPLNFAAGNLLSLYSPKRIEWGTFGRQRASQLTVLISFGLQFLVFGLAVTTVVLARYYHHIWMATVIFLGLALITIAAYLLVLNGVDRVALKRREILTTELCK